MLRFSVRFTLLVVAFLATGTRGFASEPTNGPLKVHDTNPRYFADASGKPVYLTGSHSWDNLRDWKPVIFDYDRYLRFLKEKNHNFIRLWAWDLPRFDTKSQFDLRAEEVTPFPWLRTGPGNAFDGRPRFDLTQFNPAYFERLQHRVEAARDQGVYVSIMLFEGWNAQNLRDEESKSTHPFLGTNNCNNINVAGNRVYSLADKDVLKIQEAYVQKVIETVGDLDNVLFEIINEAHLDTTPWQYHLIDFIHNLESTKPLQHPVGMTYPGRKKSLEPLHNSPADWISPGGKIYYDDPPAADGRQVVINDSDHVQPMKAEHPWVWKSFCRGMNVILMDAFTIETYGNFDRAVHQGTERCRNSMGHTKSFADRMDLAHAIPHDKLSSTRYCLANPGAKYLVYQPEKGDFTVDLKPGTYDAEWFDPIAGVVAKTEQITTQGGTHSFAPPLDSDSVLYLVATRFHGLKEFNPPAAPSAKKTTAIVGATLIDGRSGPAVRDSVVVVRGNSIVAAGPRASVSVPKDAELFDASGLTLMPGLIDAHFHIGSPRKDLHRLPPLVLSHGVTTARDPGRPIKVYAPIRDFTAAMPRMFLTGPHFDEAPPTWPDNAIVLESPGECRDAVRRFVDQGASAIKVYFRLSLESIQATCEQSHDLGIPVTAHLELVDADQAIRAGMDGIEHITSFGTVLAEPQVAKEFRESVRYENDARKTGRYRLWATLDLENSERVDPLLELLGQRRTFVSPTLATFERRLGDKNTELFHIRGFEKMLKFTGMCHKARAIVVVGSHTWPKHGEVGWAFQREMELLIESGMEPLEVITAATLNNAHFLGCSDRLGSIASGKVADLLLLEGDPLKDIRAMYNVHKVMLNGQWVDQTINARSNSRP